MKNIIRWSLWQRRWSIFWWSLGIGVFAAINLAFYPAVRNQAQLEAQFSQIPSSVKSLVTDTGDFLSPAGFLSSQIYYLMLPLMFGAMTISLGSGLIAREENDSTVELLLSRPISRARLLMGKAVCGLIILGIVGGVVTAIILLLSSIVNIALSLGNIALASLWAVCLSLLIGAIAFFVATLGRWGRLASVGVAALIGLGSYIITSLSSLAPWLKWPDKLLPYHYYRPGEILQGRYSWWVVAGYLAASLGLGILSWLALRHRDLVSS